jgi:ornithine cyclodeaminase/alanine dehydrogenase-like protein (mu-crystallin family)
MIILSDRDVGELLSPRELIPAIEAAVRRYDSGHGVVPPRQHLDWNGNTLLTMPAATAEALGTKLVAVVPGNSARGLPVTNGLMILNDAQTGLPLAILNAAALTARRTGAIGAVGTKYMTPADLDTVGIIGVGVQGTWQAIFTCCVRPIREVLYVARSPDSGERFSAALGEHAADVRVTRCADTLDLLARASLIITATRSAEPVLPDDPALLQGKHFASVGSFRPSMQELPDSVYGLAGKVVIDSDTARDEVGDVLGPIERGVLKASDVFFIGQLVAGRRSVDVRATTAYKSVGMALYDLVAAQVAYSAAKLRGIGREIEL